MNEIREIKDYIQENNIKSVEELCDKYLEEELTSERNKAFRGRINCWLEKLDDKVEYKYLEIYKRDILVPRLFKKYFTQEVFTEAKVMAALILTHGRDFPDGFSGVIVKQKPYKNEFVVELKDGERGTLFCKTYKGFPTLSQLIMDSIFNIQNKDLEEVEEGFTLIDLFN